MQTLLDSNINLYLWVGLLFKKVPMSKDFCLTCNDMRLWPKAQFHHCFDCYQVRAPVS